METGEQQGIKKARIEPPVVRIDKAKFHCPICAHPLKPPVFQCSAGHLACDACHGQLADKDRCYKQGCAQTGGYSRNLPLEDVLHTTKISCPFISFGCSSSVALYEMGEHEAKCRHMPCRCPEPGCSFVATLTRIGEHLRDLHSWRARSFNYGEAFCLELSWKMPRFVLLAKKDGQVFVVVMDSVHVSLVCLRPSGAATGPPHYTCQMMAEGATVVTGKVSSYSVEMESRSHAVTWPPRFNEPRLMAGPCEELRLLVAINKVDG